MTLKMESRKTVVAAVNGVSAAEFDFLASAWQKYSNLSAYDPEMSSMLILHAQLKKRGVQPEKCMLVKGSVTDFGHHMPSIDLLVPFPGPWVKELAGDLAYCLEHVLGSDSQAYILTDNEPESNYAEYLRKRVEEINSANASTQVYRRMEVSVTELNEKLTSFSLGGANLAISHRPGFRLIEVTRK